MPKILLAEDDVKVREAVADWLKNEDYIVEAVGNGEEASDRLTASSYDLLLLDWDMPGITGIELCRRFRKSGGTTPIIILTGKRELDDKEQGLDSGADDYITKPFELRELSARIRAVMRRPAAVEPDTLRMRGLELDCRARELRLNGKVIELLPRELAVLEFLMRHPNQVFNIEALQRRIWPSDSETSPEALRVYIARIRNKIEVDSPSPTIKTIRGEGYLFDARS